MVSPLPDSATLESLTAKNCSVSTRAYRLFNEYAPAGSQQRAMILKSPDDYIEALYSNWYLAELSRNWNEVLEAENRMQAWQIPGVPRQQTSMRW